MTYRSPLTRHQPAPLPANPDDWVRQFESEPNLNDEIERYHDRLMHDPEKKPVYVKFLNSVWDEDCVEGSCSLDNAEACRMIRELAREEQHSFVGDKKLATLSKSLNVVMRRYKLSRKERRMTVEGEQVHETDRNEG